MLGVYCTIMVYYWRPNSTAELHYWETEDAMNKTDQTNRIRCVITHNFCIMFFWIEDFRVNSILGILDQADWYKEWNARNSFWCLDVIDDDRHVSSSDPMSHHISQPLYCRREPTINCLVCSNLQWICGTGGCWLSK